MQINSQELVEDFKAYILEDTPSDIEFNRTSLTIKTNDYPEITVDNKFVEIFDFLETQTKYSNKLIFGKDQTLGVVALEVVDGEDWLYLQDGSIKKLPHKYWVLAPKNYDGSYKLLEGNLHYRYIKVFESKNELNSYTNRNKRRYDLYQIWDEQESAMVWHGVTLFKGLTVNDVSVLAWDIEGAGLARNKDADVYVITNTFRDRSGNIVKKLFRQDEYENTGEMIRDWCTWVCSVDPDILNGHNIFGYDLDYMLWVMNTQYDDTLYLGRDGSSVTVNKRDSKFRVDGSQEWKYKNIQIHGRHIIDGMFLSVKYDFGRKYPSWKLKEIIDFELQEILKKKKKDLTVDEKKFIERQEHRQFYDASKIKDNWGDPKEREKIVNYCEDDGDDSLFLYDLMIPSYFYYTQSIPRTFQKIINSNTGGQTNSFLVRAYLQDRHSIPKASQHRSYQGAISFGDPGVYHHVNKIDVASLYPSIMIVNKVYDPEKDPKAYFYKMVKYFTEERLKNKRIGKETGDRYYKDLEQSMKITINSAYGSLGTRGLNFNNFDLADFVTEQGREILQKGVEWVCGRRLIQVPKLLKNGEPETYPNGNIKKEWIFGEKISDGKGFTLVNVDTDSFSYSTGKQLKSDDFELHIKEVNSMYPDGIRWEDDGQFKTVLVNKAKNYALLDYKGKEIKIKGSGLKATMKEPALRELTREIIEHFIFKKQDRLFSLYNQYCSEVLDNKLDIVRWASKKTITQAVLNPERTTEEKIYNAIEGKMFQEGDKIFTYFDENEEIKLIEDYSGDHHIEKLLGKIYQTFEVFSTVFDMQFLPNYCNKGNRDLLECLKK